MEIFKELHVSVAEALESSFDNAYHKLESEMTANAARLAGTQNQVAAANEARQEAEYKAEELQREVLALKDELKSYEVCENNLELPEKYAKLDIEFDPERVWSGDPNEVGHLREILETKYKDLYCSLSTFTQSWHSLKAKVMQHKKKLQQWDKQLRRDHFTLMVEGAPVTFQRVKKPVGGDPRGISGLPNAMQSQCDSTNKELIVKSEPIASQGISSIQSTQSPTATQSDSDLSMETSDSLPDLQTRKRKRISPHSHPPNPQEPARIKPEPLSSSPANNVAFSLGLHIPSTQDLDEIGDTIQTPTKRYTQREARRNESASRMDPNRTSNQSNVLQPIDVNVRTRVLDRSSPNKKPKHVDRHRFLAMTEDGDAYDSESHGNPKKRALNHAVNSRVGNPKIAQGRLQSLLEGPGPSRPPIGSKPDEKTTNLSCGNDADTSFEELLRNGDTTPKQIDSISQQDLDVHPEDEPFRSRPIKCLTLEHFKLNPARNQGLDYAYDAVVRKRDDRRCLAGCTRPECCGDRFRAMARLGGLPARSPAKQQEEDRKMLKDYMGDEYPMLENMNSSDRESLLVEARARALANQYGKHRHNHQRAQTPPGFWRTDMPSTQELESDREAAKQMDRERVEQRYREAMRPGGLWTWADE